MSRALTSEEPPFVKPWPNFKKTVIFVACFNWYATPESSVPMTRPFFIPLSFIYSTTLSGTLSFPIKRTGCFPAMIPSSINSPFVRVSCLMLLYLFNSSILLSNLDPLLMTTGLNSASLFLTSISE